MSQDKFTGQGGSYIMDKDGERIRVETTEDHPDDNCAREATLDDILRPLAISIGISTAEAKLHIKSVNFSENKS